MSMFKALTSTNLIHSKTRIISFFLCMDEGHPEGPLSLFLSYSFQVNGCYSEWSNEVFTQKDVVYSIKFTVV